MKDTTFLAILIVVWALIDIKFSDMDHNEVIDAIEKPKFEYDYMIDLQTHDSCHSIHILDEYDHMHVIHPDSLEEFITKDNL